MILKPIVFTDGFFLCLNYLQALSLYFCTSNQQYEKVGTRTFIHYSVFTIL